MYNKKIKLCSLFFFVALVFFLISLVDYIVFAIQELSEYNILTSPYFISASVIDILIYIALGVFLIEIANVNNKDYLVKAKKWWIGIFIFFIVCFVIVSISNSINFSNNFLRIIMFIPRQTPFSGLFNTIRYFPFSHFNFFCLCDLLCELLSIAGFIAGIVFLNDAITHFDSQFNESDNSNLPKMMSFGEAIKSCYSNYLSFNGCATRAEYWFFQLYVSIIGFILLLFAKQALSNYNLTAYKNILIVTIVFAIFNIYPSFCVTIRRMHDAGHIGAYYIIPIAGFVALFMPSEPFSEYRTRRDLHPICDVLVKLLILIIIIGYIYLHKLYHISKTDFLLSSTSINQMPCME